MPCAATMPSADSSSRCGRTPAGLSAKAWSPRKASLRAPRRVSRSSWRRGLDQAHASRLGRVAGITRRDLAQNGFRRPDAAYEGRFGFSTHLQHPPARSISALN